MIDNNTPLSFLTIGDLQQIINTALSDALKGIAGNKTEEPDKEEENKRYAHCLADIASAWGCSIKTAQSMKNNELAPYISQEEGRRIFTLDIDYAKQELSRRGIKKRKGCRS